MHIVRWLMSHPIISAWLLAGLAILLNFDSGSHKNDEHKAATNDSHIEQSHEQAPSHDAEAATTTTEAGNVTSTGVASATESAAAPAPAEQGSASHSVAPVSSVTTASAPATQNAAPAITAPVVATQAIAAQSAPESAPATPSKEAPVTTATTGQGSAAQAVAAPQAATADANLSSKAPTELLQMARQAYQDKNLNSSVAAYQALIKLEPGKIEYKGELGNVYYHQNKQKEAANMYAEIALPLIDQGKAEHVANMLGFIGAFYPQKAAKINQYMQAHKK